MSNSVGVPTTERHSLTPRQRDTVDRLVDAAVEEVRSVGFAGLTVRNVAARAGVPMVAPPVRLCTDNAVMVAWAGIERLRAGLVDRLDHAPRPRWPLAELAVTAA